MANYLDKTGLALVWTKIKLLLADKVDKVDGKGLSSNDYTSEEKAKLANIEAGAEANVQSDWNAVSGDAFIINKPSIPQATAATPLMDGTAAVGTADTFARADHVHPSDTSKVDVVAGKGLSTNDFTDALKEKLDGISPGATTSTGTVTSVATGAGLTGGPVTTSGTIKANLKSETAATYDSDTPSNTQSRQYAVTPDKSGYLSVNVPWTDTTYTAATANPLMDGTAAIGTSAKYAKEDHVHPSDTTKVDKVTGKGLSTNDFTDALETKLEGVAAGAQVNVIETIKVNNTALTPSSKTVNITVPTNNNQLTNGAGYQTASEVSSAINSAIGDLEGIEFEIVQELPQNGDKGKIYLVANTDPASNNTYTEYIWLTSSSSYEKIGTTDVDLSDYYNTTNLVAITSNEIDTVCT